MKISFVIPCYRSEKTIEIVIDEIRQRMSEMRAKGREDDYDIILVNDCSPDKTVDIISIESVSDFKNLVKGNNYE